MAQDRSLEQVHPSIPLDFLASFKTQFLPFKDFDNKYRVLKCKNGNIYAYKFGVKNQVGEGGFGQVYEGYQINCETGQCEKKVAIKLFDVFDEQELKAEIVSLREQGFDPENEVIKAAGKAYIVMDFVPGRELNVDEFLDATEHSFSEVINLALQISFALNKMHHNSVRATATVHSDIKPGNIRVFVQNKKLKDARIVDFGLAAKVEDDQDSLTLNNTGGTPEYAAPETKDRAHGPKSDIYSFGLILQEMFEKVNIPGNLKPIITAFVQQMHTHEYDVRPNSGEVLRFFNSVNNYLKANDAQKADQLAAIEKTWIDCAKEVDKIYTRSQITAFLDVLSKHENSDKKFKDKRQELIEKLFKSNDVNNKLGLFLHLVQTEKKKRKRTELADEILDKIREFSGKDAVLFLRAIGNDENTTRAALKKLSPETADDSLRLFIHLSKRENYNSNSKEKWIECVERVSQHHDQYSPKKLLIIMRKLNTHELKYKDQYKQLKDPTIKDRLDKIKAAKKGIAEILTKATNKSVQGKCFLSAERFAARKLNYAVTGSFTFFNDYRAKCVLKDATKTEKDERIHSIVTQLKVGI